MKKNKRIILLLGITALFSACSKEVQPQATPPQPVKTLAVKSENLALKFTYPAKLVSDYDVVLKPQVSGVLVEKYFKAGDHVKKGDKLFLIEPDKFKANFDSAWGNELMARANFDNAKKDHERNENLFQKKAISQKEYDTSLALFKSSRASLESAKAAVASAKFDYNNTSVVAPFDGVVGDSLVNIGEFITASSSELVRLTNLNPIYADFYISDIDKINVERNVQSGNWDLTNFGVSLEVSGLKREGNLYFIDSVIDANSASVKAKAIFENNDSSLLPGAFGEITSEGFMQKNGFKVPRIAILQDQRETYVYLYKEGNVSKNNVKISYQNNDYAVVESGLKNGDKIIIDNFKKIRPGVAVRDVGSK